MAFGWAQGLKLACGLVFAVVIAGAIAPAKGEVKISRMGDHYGIDLSGRINEQMKEEFLKVVSDPRINGKEFVGVRLSSQGGSIIVAMAIGEIIRTASFHTGVYPGSECSSACVLLLAAGVTRTVTGKVGIHRPRFDEEEFGKLSYAQASEKYEQMAATMRQYLARMGMADSLYFEMLKTQADTMRFLSAKDTLDFNLEGEDPAWREWNRARAIARSGREHYEMNQSYAALVAACANTTGRSVERCVEEIRSVFERRVNSCAERPGNDIITCAKDIERQMMAKYR